MIEADYRRMIVGSLMQEHPPFQFFGRDSIWIERHDSNLLGFRPRLEGDAKCDFPTTTR
jgi:hypothetical protein